MKCEHPDCKDEAKYFFCALEWSPGIIELFEKAGEPIPELPFCRKYCEGCTKWMKYYAESRSLRYSVHDL